MITEIAHELYEHNLDGSLKLDGKGGKIPLVNSKTGEKIKRIKYSSGASQDCGEMTLSHMLEEIFRTATESGQQLCASESAGSKFVSQVYAFEIRNREPGILVGKAREWQDLKREFFIRDKNNMLIPVVASSKKTMLDKLRGLLTGETKGVRI